MQGLSKIYIKLVQPAVVICLQCSRRSSTEELSSRSLYSDLFYQYFRSFYLLVHETLNLHSVTIDVIYRLMTSSISLFKLYVNYSSKFPNFIINIRIKLDQFKCSIQVKL